MAISSAISWTRVRLGTARRRKRAAGGRRGVDGRPFPLIDRVARDATGQRQRRPTSRRSPQWLSRGDGGATPRAAKRWRRRRWSWQRTAKTEERGPLSTGGGEEGREPQKNLLSGNQRPQIRIQDVTRSRGRSSRPPSFVRSGHRFATLTCPKLAIGPKAGGPKAAAAATAGRE